jgi:putative ABC transport system substrate-binding protein
MSPGGNKRIVILESGKDETVRQHTRWFKAHLHDLGYREGGNLDLVVLQAEGDQERAAGLLRKVVTEKRPDVVVTNGLLAAQQGLAVLAPLKIPQVFCNVADPAGWGLIREIGRPTESGLTGVAFAIDRQTEIDLAMRLAGQVVSGRPVRLGYIHGNDEAALADLRALSAIASARRDIVFLSYPPEPGTVDSEPASEPAAGPGENDAPGSFLVDAAINALNDQVDFWWEPAGPSWQAEGSSGPAEEFPRLLLERAFRPILMGAGPVRVQQGALLSITPSVEASGRETALLVGRILGGAEPGALPSLRPESFDLALNLTTAINLGIAVPVDILELAGERLYK